MFPVLSSLGANYVPEGVSPRSSRSTLHSVRIGAACIVRSVENWKSCMSGGPAAWEEVVNATNICLLVWFARCAVFGSLEYSPLSVVFGLLLLPFLGSIWSCDVISLEKGSFDEENGHSWALGTDPSSAGWWCCPSRWCRWGPPSDGSRHCFAATSGISSPSSAGWTGLVGEEASCRGILDNERINEP